MFKDTKQGETHSYNDGCGEPAHNPKLPQHIEKRLVEILDETLIDGGYKLDSDTSNHDNWFTEEEAKLRIKSFIATILEEERERVMKILDKHRAWKPTCGYGSEEEKGYQKGLQAEAKLIAQEILSIS